MSGSSESYVSEPSTIQPSTSQSSTSQPLTSKSSILEHTILEFAEFEILTRNSMVTILEIVRKAQDVSVDLNMLKENTKSMISYISKHIRAGSMKDIISEAFRRSNDYFHIKDDKMMIDWLFVLNALNFSLWNSPNSKQWTVHGLTGYKALCFAIRRAIDEGRPMWDPNYYSKLEQTEIEIIFRSDDNETRIPLIHERVRTLHEIGRVLLDKYEGTFVNCVQTCECDALKLRHLLYNEFESYRDTVNYEGKEVYIGCKAATLISDLNSFNFVSGETRWISTIFADYCAPRALLHLGILRYSDRLKARFAETDKPLEHGSREDLEIRCCSLIACRRWCQEIATLYKRYVKQENLQEKLMRDTMVIIDRYLWIHRHSMDKTKFLDTVPFHNIRSVYY